MPATLGSAPLLTPWFGTWDVLQGSAEHDILLVTGLFAAAMAGIVLALYSGHLREQSPERKTVAVPILRQLQPKRRRRR
jgi:hypothetical protein